MRKNLGLFKRLKIALGLVIITALLVIFTNVQSLAVFTFELKNNLTKVPQYQADMKIEEDKGEKENIKFFTSIQEKFGLTLSLRTSLSLLRRGNEGEVLNVLDSTDSISQNPSIPPQKNHPLPSTLARWQDNNSGDYFDEIKPTKYGYLIWSQFPVKVYLETPNTNNNQQSQQWINAVSEIVEEWNNYLPLKIVENSEEADIKIIRKSPPLQFTPGQKFPRARSALAKFQTYTKNNTLYHRFTILLSPSQTGKYLLAASRHELGHALGIWGHSTDKGDALYFSQVRNPPMVSNRDVNTLKKIYQQSTSLGLESIFNQ
ncbi:MAG: matrixin family metalloprotease [Cyanobacteria bacterium J06573_2]